MYCTFDGVASSVRQLSYDPAWVITGGENQALGSAVAGAGDVNGDGFSDLLVSAPFFDVHVRVGRVWEFHGSSGGPPTMSN